jgi:hypothetical protein
MSVYGTGMTVLASGAGGTGESHDLMMSDVMEHEVRLINYTVYSNWHYINSKLICLPSRC